MTLTLNLDAETEARLQARALEIGGDTEAVAAMLLADLLRAEPGDPDTELTEEEWAEIESGILHGEVGFVAGRFRMIRSECKPRSTLIPVPGRFEPAALGSHP